MLEAIIIGSLYVLLFVFTIRKMRFFLVPGFSVNAICLVFVAKVIVSGIFWQLFMYKHPLTDANVFFNDSKILYDLFFNDTPRFFKLFFGLDGAAALPDSFRSVILWNDTFDTFLINDSRTMIRLNTFFRFFSFEQFQVHLVFMCFISFVGFIYLYKLFHPYLPDFKFALIGFLFFIPSVLFWGSGVLKEGLLFLGMGIFLYHTACGTKLHFTSKNVTGILAGFLILLAVKVYVLMALLPPVIANYWITSSQNKRIFLKHILTVAVIFISMACAHLISPQFNFLQKLKEKQTRFIKAAKGGIYLYNNHHYVFVDYTQKSALKRLSDSTFRLNTELKYLSFDNKDTAMVSGSDDTTTYRIIQCIIPAGSAYTVPVIEATPWGIAKCMPVAFYNVLFLPQLFAAGNPFALLISIENTILLLFSITMVLFFRNKQFNKKIVFFCISFVVILFTLIGLTTPVIGAAVRYKTPALPFLMVSVLLLTDKNKLKKSFLLKNKVINRPGQTTL